MARDCVHARVLGCDAGRPRVRALVMTMTTIPSAIPHNTVILEVTNQIKGRVRAHGFLRLRDSGIPYVLQLSSCRKASNLSILRR